MIVPDDIEQLLRYSLVPQSIDQLRPDFPRWCRRLEAEGVHTLPAGPHLAGPTDEKGMNWLAQLVRQAAPEHDADVEHHLRNMTGVRPWR